MDIKTPCTLMKELLFLRHAKSFWGWSLEDHDRPLQPKGIKAITTVSKYWKSTFQSMEVVYSSPANRALTTAVLMLRHVHIPYDRLELVESLYTFESEKVLRFISSLSDLHKRVMIVGHNPAFSSAASHLSRDVLPELKTADWVKLSFPQQSWKNIQSGTPSFGSKKTALNANE